MSYLAQDLAHRLLDRGDLMPTIAIVGGLLVGALAITFITIKGMYVARQREQTKRELAAYVAEGSIEPDKAVALLKADHPTWEVGADDFTVKGS